MWARYPPTWGRRIRSILSASSASCRIASVRPSWHNTGGRWTVRAIPLAGSICCGFLRLWAGRAISANRPGLLPGTGAHGLPPWSRRTSWSTHELPPRRSAQASVDYLPHLGLGRLHAEIGDDPGCTGPHPWFRVVARRDVHDHVERMICPA